MLFIRRRIQSVVATVLGLRMEVVVVYRGRVRAPREARVVFWEGVRSGLGWQEAAVAAGFPRGAAGPGAVDGEPGGAQELPVPGPVPGDGGAAAGGGPGAAAEGG